MAKITARIFHVLDDWMTTTILFNVVIACAIKWALRHVVLSVTW